MIKRFLELLLNPLQCSCLENPRDGGAWRAAVYGVAQSRTRLKRLSSSSSSKGPLQPSEVAIEGVSGIPFYPQITPPLPCSFDKTTLTHSFIVVSQCPMALMGHDLLAKPQISINLPFLDPTSILCIQMAPKPLASPHSQNLPPDLPLIDPQVWDTKTPLVA